jgi:nucleoside-diphosphate-sugar epimerase
MALNDGRVVSNFAVQALKNEDITIYGTGDQTRSFCYVEDLIEGLIKLFFTENLHVPVNLGNPSSVSVLELANEIIKITQSESKISFKPLPLDDPTNREPDISKARKLLNWNPKIEREEGLEKTILYFRQKLKEE